MGLAIINSVGSNIDTLLAAIYNTDTFFNPELDKKLVKMYDKDEMHMIEIKK